MSIPTGTVFAMGCEYAPWGSLPCDGRILAVQDFPALFEVIGPTYGGDGAFTFALPDLRGRAPRHGSYLGRVVEPLAVPEGEQAGDEIPGSVALTWCIQVSEGDGTSRPGQVSWEPYTSQVSLMAGTYVPSGWFPCDGRSLPLAYHTTLYSLLLTRFGGDGVTTFRLPDLRGATPVGPDTGETGARQAPVPASTGTDATIADRLRLTWCICETGIYPSRG